MPEELLARGGFRVEAVADLTVQVVGVAIFGILGGDGPAELTEQGEEGVEAANVEGEGFALGKLVDDLLGYFVLGHGEEFANREVP